MHNILRDVIFTFEICLPVIIKIKKKTSINTDMMQVTKFMFVQMSIQENYAIT